MMIIKRVLILLICWAMTGGVAHAQGLPTEEDEEVSTEEAEGVSTDEEEEPLTEKLDDQTFWAHEVDAKEEWGLWLKEVYKPYADEMTVAMLKIVASTADIDYKGKTSEEILEEVNAAYDKSLRSMETVKAPAEFKAYHTKVVRLYRQTIEADPKDKKQNAIERAKLSAEVDEAMTKALKLHGVPQRVIYYINHN